jgi:agmatine deiminase
MRAYLLVFLCSVAVLLKAQAPLPKGFAPNERITFIGLPEVPVAPDVYYTPPVGSDIRTAAEWEEIQGLCITWTSYQSVLKEIVRAARTETTVYIICGSTCSGSTDSTSIKNYLISNSIPLSNIRYIYAPCNSVWIRDYGPNTVYRAGVDSISIVDWKYNRPTRVKDDTVPRSIGRKMNIPVFEMSQGSNTLISTGGNWMSDGFGNAFGSNLILDENQSLTTAQIDQLAQTWMGINSYTHMTTLPYDGIHHIDMHMKLLDEETILVGQYPQGVADGPQIDANIQYILSNYTSKFGTPYRIIRIPQPPDQINGYSYPNSNGNYLTYANATFINKTVIVPQFYTQYDTTAIRIWKQALPGYKIVGINSNSTISASGSLHCITHSIGVDDPLLISHQPLPNTSNTSVPYEVQAEFRHRSGISTATLFYRTDTTQPYQSTSMSFSSGNIWTAQIPAQPSGTTVYYYIKGEANSGKTLNRPMPAPAAYWKFKVMSPTTVSENFSNAKIKVYPNPSHGITCIEINSDGFENSTVGLFDMLGREVLKIHEGAISSGTKNLFFNSIALDAGTYTLRITNGIEARQQKLIIW